MLDWDELRTFLAISRQGNLSAAARELGLTQTTMRRRLEALHERAGARLLAKTPSGFLLTPAGEKILAHVERMEMEALALERAVSGEDERLEGLVRLTTVESLAARIVVPSLARFRDRYPGITIEIDVDTRSLSLSRRETDIALRVAAFAQHEAMVKKLGRLAFALYGSKAYLARHARLDFSTGLAGHSIVTLQEDLLQMPEAKWLRSLAGNAAIAARTNSREGQFHAAMAGIGLACLPRYIADTEPSLSRLDSPLAAPIRDIWLGIHRDTRRQPRIRAVIDHVTETIRLAQPILNPPVK